MVVAPEIVVTPPIIEPAIFLISGIIQPIFLIWVCINLVETQLSEPISADEQGSASTVMIGKIIMLRKDEIDRCAILHDFNNRTIRQIGKCRRLGGNVQACRFSKCTCSNRCAALGIPPIKNTSDKLQFIEFAILIKSIT